MRDIDARESRAGSAGAPLRFRLIDAEIRNPRDPGSTRLRDLVGVLVGGNVPTIDLPLAALQPIL